MTLILQAKKRSEIGKKIKHVRNQGFIPGILYGHNVQNVNLSVPFAQFRKIYQQAGESTLVDLKVDDAESPVKVIIQDVQRDPVKGEILHVDFHQVNMREKLHAHITLKFTGIAPALKNFDGVLVTGKSEIEVHCLPSDLVHEIEVDLSSLKQLNDAIHIKDLIVPSGIEILDAASDIIVSVTESKTEKEAETMAQAPVAEVKVEPELVGKKEKEAEEADGEAEEKGGAEEKSQKE